MKTTGTRRRSGSGINDKAIVMEHVSKAYTVGIPCLLYTSDAADD